MRKTKKVESDITDVQVRLKPVFGIPPGTYLTVLYALIVLAVLFLLLFYPGIRRRGTYVSVQSFPPAAVVQVDGVYAGATPCTVLVAPGAHTLRLEKPFFRTREFSDDFGGRVFGTLFVKPRRQLSFDLDVQDPDALLEFALTDFAANPHIPEIITDTVQAGFQAAGPAERAIYYDYLDNVKYFVTNKLQFSRLLAASTRLAAGGKLLTPGALIELAGTWTDLLERYDNLLFWLLLSLPEETSREVTRSAWFEQYLARYRQAGGEEGPPAPVRGTPVDVGGLRFRPVPGGVLQQGVTDADTLTPLLAHGVTIPAFYLAETEVSNRLYQRFLAASPRWRKSNLESLLAEGLVGESYLADWEEDSYPAGEADLPVVQVSFFAAEAFCRWLASSSTGLPSGYTVRIPYESEWEYAARGGLAALPYPTGSAPGSARFLEEGVEGPLNVGASEPNGYGLKDMSGNVWEWCADWYSPVRYFFTSWDAGRNLPGSGGPPAGFERVVRGGSWANRADLVKLYTRASQPGDWCTPYLGFRPLLIRP
jgi:iron(II)-dependent oxidoreductase